MPIAATYEAMKHKPAEVVRQRMSELLEHRLRRAMQGAYQSPEEAIVPVPVDMGRVRIQMPPEAPVTVRLLSEAERAQYGPSVCRSYSTIKVLKVLMQRHPAATQSVLARMMGLTVKQLDGRLDSRGVTIEGLRRELGLPSLRHGEGRALAAQMEAEGERSG